MNFPYLYDSMFRINGIRTVQVVFVIFMISNDPSINGEEYSLRTSIVVAPSPYGRLMAKLNFKPEIGMVLY